jgi:hypothetical protein
MSKQIELYDETVSNVKPIEFARKLGVPAQMIYSYIRAGRIAHYVSDSGHKLIATDVANAFITKRNEKAASK